MSDGGDHDTYVDESKPEPIYINLPPRLLVLPAAALFAGATIGFVRGTRTASLRFLAENVHRPPTTVQGWYFYNKTKNYRVLLGGLKGGGKDALALAATALGWVGIEEGVTRLGKPWNEFREVGAGLGTAGVFSAACECMFFTSIYTVEADVRTATWLQTACHGRRRVERLSSGL
jgi:hypothetical protein